MACRVADADEHGHSSTAGSFEGSVSPWIPVNWVVGMLLKVRARFKQEAVGVHRRSIGISVSCPRLVCESPVIQCLGELLLKSGRKGFCAGRRLE
jgi:hypothetical protein